MEDAVEDSLLELEEAHELQGIVKRVVASAGRDAGAVLPRYKQILTKYQEQPQLLDGSLESLVQPLATLLRDHAIGLGSEQQQQEEEELAAGTVAAICGVCRLLHVLVTVRGHKTVVRFFPHEAADLERVLQVLLSVKAAAEAGPPPGPGSEDAALAAWEAQSVLLLWLSILILTPFDLRTVDSAVGEGGVTGEVTPLAARIVALCQGYLDHPGTAREMAALLLARLLTRPDMGPALEGFLAWQLAALADAVPARLQFLLPGVLQTLALVFKLGRRPVLLPYAPRVWSQLGSLWDEAEAAAPDGLGGSGDASGASSAGACLGGSSLARRLAVKLAQRIGLTLLVPCVARWRYVRQRATLLGGADAAAAGSLNESGSPEGVDGSPDDEGDAIHVPDEAEELLGCLLGGLRDRDTAVRWTASKGVARITGCLSAELGADVIDGVMELFGPAESDTAWHGGCLALAELARRSLLLPSRLPSVAPIVSAALSYDVRRGPHSVGAHVRDAAAYVCWAFARAYDPSLLGDRFLGLGGPLLTAAVYDREVHVRRAAASAFQEAVGRLGGALPHGLDLLGAVDCFSVANMSAAFLRAAPQVAAFPEHRGALLAHLLGAKLRHWEKPTRALAARALAALVPAAGPQWVAARALPALLGRMTDDALEARCGAVLGIAELLPALAAAGLTDLSTLSDNITSFDGGEAEGLSSSVQEAAAGDLAERVAGVLCVLEAARLYRGKGGELMREAAARLVDCTAQAVSGLRRQQGSGRPVCNSPEEEDGSSNINSGGGADSRPGSGAGSGGTTSPVGGGAADGSIADAAPSVAVPGAAPRLRQTRLPRLSLPLGPEYHRSALALIEDCLCHPLGSIRAAGAAALASHARAHCTCPEAAVALDGLIDRCLARLTDTNLSHRRGAAEALGSIPRQMLLSPSPARAAAIAAAVCRAVSADALGPDDRDVEARVAAVEALGRMAVELYASDSSNDGGALAPSDQLQGAQQPLTAPQRQQQQQQQQGEQVAPPSGLLSRKVVPALLGALRDYTTDNRGDVGSWVRGAAMEALVAVVPLAVAEGSVDGVLEQQQQDEQQQVGQQVGAGIPQQQQPQQQSSQQQDEEVVAVVVGRDPSEPGSRHDETKQPDQQQPACTAVPSANGAQKQRPAGAPAAPAPQPPAACSPAAVPGVVVGELLRIGVERIARLREAAVAHLRTLLAHPATAGLVPAAAAVAAALPTDAVDAAGVASLVGVDRLSALLAVSDYSGPLLEGLVASIGGVDASLSKAASSALLVRIEEGSGSGSEGSSLAERIPFELVRLWERERSCESSRLSLPLLRTAHLLITGADAADAPVSAAPASETAALGDTSAPATTTPDDATTSFATRVLGLARLEVRGCADVPRLLEGASLIAALAGAPGCGYAALQSAAALLVNRFPRVRRHMAEQLYLTLLAAEGADEWDDEEDDGGEAGEGDKAQEAAAVGSGGDGSWRLPGSEEGMEAALDVLLTSPWDGSLDGARAARGELMSLLRVEVRAATARGAGRNGGGVAAAKAAAAQRPQNDYLSYQSLLDDAARGGGY